MADAAVLTVIAERIIKSLGSLAPQKIGLPGDFKDELQKLGNTVSTIQAVLLYAEEQQVHNHAVKDWLRKVEDAMFEADDLLDKYSTELLRRQVMGRNKMAKQVRIFFFLSYKLAYDLKMGQRINKVRKTLDEIAADRFKFGFTERPTVQEIANHTNLQVPDLSSSPSPVGTESPVQVPNLSSSPSGNGEQRSNSSISSYIPFIFLIGSMIGLLQLHVLFETHPANMWITEAALVIFCLSHAAKKKINETHRARYSQIIDGFRVLSGTLIVASLSSTLLHRLRWLFFVIWTLHVVIVVANGMKVGRGQTLPLFHSRIPPTIHPE